MSLNRDEFFEKYLIEEEYFENTGLDWNELVAIYDDYSNIVPKLEIDSQHIVLKLIDAESVHSVRKRVKNPEHLLEKIIRKGKKYVELGINRTNYKRIVTDLIGIRVLHLFKDDWLAIHEEIMHLWEVKEIPQVNIRKGDNDGVDFEKMVEEEQKLIEDYLEDFKRKIDFFSNNYIHWEKQPNEQDFSNHVYNLRSMDTLSEDWDYYRQKIRLH